MLQLLKPARPRAHAQQQEMPPQWEAHEPQLESNPCSNEDPVQAKNSTKTKLKALSSYYT